MRAEVSIRDQGLRLLDAAGRMVAWYPVSTSRFGIGFEPGSNRTPTGRFRICRKIGGGAPSGTIFRSRRRVGRWDGQPLEEDLVLTRILWLDGLDPDNANTRGRYIYLHGTNQEDRIGTPASHGCVRLRNADIIDLFTRLREGDEVVIHREAPGIVLPGGAAPGGRPQAFS
jgi:lipoprotein-anchoring transpeptidase ErfK/SrfK